MREETFVQRSRMPAAAEALFRWHAEPGALARLTPPWEPVEVVGEDLGLALGREVELRIRMAGVAVRWVSKIVELVAGRGFKDVQIRGPFARWEHEHRMEPDGPLASYLEDRVVYVLPGGFAGRWLGGALVRRKLAKLFAYRHQVTAAAMAAAAAVQKV